MSRPVSLGKPGLLRKLMLRWYVLCPAAAFLGTEARPVREQVPREMGRVRRS
jgi:hypothetical protein